MTSQVTERDPVPKACLRGKVGAQVPLAGTSEVDAAVSAGQAAFARWRKVAAAERRRPLLRLADLIEGSAGEFSRLSAIDNGTPLTSDVVSAYAQDGNFAQLASEAGILDGVISVS